MGATGSNTCMQRRPRCEFHIVQLVPLAAPLMRDVMLLTWCEQKYDRMRPMKDRTDKGIISQTLVLYTSLSGEARRMSQRDREVMRRRKPAVKALLVTCLAAGFLAVATLVYGFITFPDGPVRETASGYGGKHQEPHTHEEYEQFKFWEKLVIVSFGLTFLTGLGGVVAEKMSQDVSAKPSNEVDQ
jgi:hypothetical protein